MHRAPRRPARPVVHHAGIDRRYPQGAHDRGAARRRLASGAARMGRGRRRAVRLLPIRSDHDCRRVARAEARSQRRRYRCSDVGQYLSLRHLHADSRGHSSGRQAEPRRCQMTLTRRELLRSSDVSTAGLVIAFHIPRVVRGAPQPPAPPLPKANAFLRIGPDDSVTVMLSHSEMGQGIWTGLAMLIAEELECDWSKVRSEHAPADMEYRHVAFGIQMTGGSSSTWSEFERYRQVGAIAKDMLIRAAAARWKV